jgi:hypothetical protein
MSVLAVSITFFTAAKASKLLPTGINVPLTLAGAVNSASASRRNNTCFIYGAARAEVGTRMALFHS